MAALVTQPDRPQGRKQELIPAPIKRAAEARGIPVLQPEDVNAPESLERIRAIGPDLLVTAAYGQILSADLLSIPRLGGINLHGSVLPAYRGASPVARAIQNGDAETGVTVIRMTPRIDAGGIIAIARTEIGPDETAGELEERLARLGAPLVAQSIAALAAGPVPILPQDKAKVTRAPKLRKEDGLIDWSRPARAVHDLVRAMQPWPVGVDDLASPGRRPAGSRCGSSSTRPRSSTAAAGPARSSRRPATGWSSPPARAPSGSLVIQLEGKKPATRRRVPPRPPRPARRPHGATAADDGRRCLNASTLREMSIFLDEQGLAIAPEIA